ncbi:MAG TPA: nucleotide exchange factor GrpE [Gemmatimonadaceae bacterium]|nr:nucleotide exchange factor GrpE [Gemmatimonadaceae bacterium]
MPEPQGDGEPAPEDMDDVASAEATGDTVGQAPQPVSVDASAIARQLDEQKDKFLRLAAEYDNYRRRTAKERAEAGARGQAELIKSMMEAIDDLGRFADIDPATTDAVTLHQGIEMVERKLLKSLASVGLEVINPVDQSFDPRVHEAVATEPALSPEDDNTVAKVYQQGYSFNGQLLRAARVVVKQWNG